jgi:hypothetical protein
MASVAVAGHAQVRETPKNTTRIRPDKGRLYPQKKWNEHALLNSRRITRREEPA